MLGVNWKLPHKMTLALSAFFLLSFFSLIASFYVEFTEKQVESSSSKKQRPNRHLQITNMDYFITEFDRPKLHLQSSLFFMNESTGIGSLVKPSGSMYDKDGMPVTYRASEGEFSRDENYYTFKGDVSFSREDLSFESDKAYYSGAKEFFIGEGKVETRASTKDKLDTIVVYSKRVESYPMKKTATYTGGIYGEIKRKRLYEGSLHFSSDAMKINMNDSMAELTGSVKVKKDNMKANSMRAELFLDNYNKKLKYCAFYDDVMIEQNLTDKKGNIVNRKAYAEKAELYTLDRKAVLTGAPKVHQGEDLIKGSTITLREDTETVEIEDASSLLHIENK